MAEIKADQTLASVSHVQQHIIKIVIINDLLIVFFEHRTLAIRSPRQVYSPLHEQAALAVFSQRHGGAEKQAQRRCPSALCTARYLPVNRKRRSDG